MQQSLPLVPYYVHKECLYSVYFPEKWAVETIECTGPECCPTCQEFGFWNGVFIAYCYQCAVHCYRGERGRGMIGCGIEATYEDTMHIPSMFETYLKDVDLDMIGDTNLEDTRKRLMDESNIQSIVDFQNEYLESLNKNIEDSPEYPLNYDIKHQLSYGSQLNGGYDSH
jgi:hypothetical protein